jgi:hypothetical protein
LTTYGEWVYRLVILCGFVSILYLNQHYVTKDDFVVEVKALKDNVTASAFQINSRIDTLSALINALTTSVAVTKSKQDEMDDLKARIRDLEHESRSHKP